MFAKLNKQDFSLRIVLLPVPVMIGIGLVALGFVVAVYVVVVTIRDGRQIKPINPNED